MQMTSHLEIQQRFLASLDMNYKAICNQLARLMVLGTSLPLNAEPVLWDSTKIRLPMSLALLVRPTP
jgi:hypothetical protein